MAGIISEINRRIKYIDTIGVSIITCTNRPHYMDKVIENYSRQKYEKKELIVILNSNKIDIRKFKNAAQQYKNIKVYQLDEKKTLGECLNFAVSRASYEIIAKFDDDDYYGPMYLKDSIKVFERVEAGVIGKVASYVYFKGEKILTIRHPEMQYRYVHHINGPTLIIKKAVFKMFKFRNISLGEDTEFCNDCVKNGIKMYCTNHLYHVYIRHASSNHHTWRIDNKELLKQYKFIKNNITDYEKYVNDKNFYNPFTGR